MILVIYPWSIWKWPWRWQVGGSTSRVYIWGGGGSKSRWFGWSGRQMWNIEFVGTKENKIYAYPTAHNISQYNLTLVFIALYTTVFRKRFNKSQTDFETYKGLAPWYITPTNTNTQNASTDFATSEDISTTHKGAQNRVPISNQNQYEIIFPLIKQYN